MNKVFNKRFQGMTELADSSVRLIYADPPYGISKVSNFVNNAIGYLPSKGDWDLVDDSFLEDFASALTQDAMRVLVPGGTLAVNGMYGSLIPFFQAMKRVGMAYRNTITWVKTNPAPCIHRKNLTISCEFILVFTKPGASNSSTTKRERSSTRASNFERIGRSQ